MNRPLFGALGVAAVLTLTVGSCKSDPFSNLDGGPAALVIDFSYLQMPIGSTAEVTASVVDGRATPLAVPITFTPCTTDLTTAIDTSYHPVPATSARAIVTAVTANPSCVEVRGGGLVDTVGVAVLPQTFGGALSSTSPQGGDTLTISSTTVLKFDTSAVTVTFGGGVGGVILSKTRDQLKVLVPFSNAGPLSITGIDVTYVSGLVVTLPTAATVTQTGNRWSGSVSWQTAPDISALLPSAASSSRMIVTRGADNAAVCPEVALGFGSTGPCMMFKYTVAATTTLNFTTDWEGTALAPDVDIYVCSDSTVANFGTACFVDGGSGATGSEPQTTGNDPYAAGTYWFVIEIYDGTGPRNAFVTISRP